MNKTLIVVLFLFGSLAGYAQKKVWVGKSNKVLNIQAHYQYVLPGGDFAARFNSFNAIGGGLSIKTTHNIIYGFEGNYYFGSDLKPSSLLNNLINGNVNGGSGYIANSSGYPSQISVGMRGFSALGKVGYLIPVSASNLNSGILIMLGGGLVMHKYSINVTREDVPALTEDKRAGYDRYSSGWAFNQFVGYWHQSKNRYTNFYVGVDLMQAITYNRRKYNYDEMQYDVNSHNDNYYGIKLGWIIPRYLKTKNSDDEFIFE